MNIAPCLWWLTTYWSRLGEARGVEFQSLQMGVLAGSKSAGPFLSDYVVQIVRHGATQTFGVSSAATGPLTQLADHELMQRSSNLRPEYRRDRYLS